MITLTINGEKVQADEGMTILQAAESIGVAIPTLCHHPALEPAALCRMCTVEMFDGRRTKLVTSCNHPVRNNIEVRTHSEKVVRHRAMIAELMLARCPNNDFVKNLAAGYGIEKPRFQTENDDCLLCGLCHRACEMMGACGITFAGRGTEIEVSPPFRHASDNCIACGACAAVCPTGHMKMIDEGDEIVIKAGDIEVNRAPKQACEGCGRLFAPAVFITALKNRLPDGSEGQDDAGRLCPECARNLYAKKLASGSL